MSEPDSLLSELGIDTERLVVGALLKLASRVNNGDNGAVLELQRAIETVNVARAGGEHRLRLQELLAADDGLALARYLGEHGETTDGFEMIVGRPPTEEEETAVEQGQRLRRLEIRALELARARQAGSSIMEWMRR